MTPFSQKILTALASLLVVMAVAWGAYLYGYRVGTTQNTASSSAKISTNSATPPAQTMVGRDELFTITVDATHGIATGTVTAVSATSVTIAYKGQSAVFAIDDKTTYSGKATDKTGIKVGSKATIPYEKKTDGTYLAISFNVQS
jgi:hypothetical protein